MRSTETRDLLRRVRRTHEAMEAAHQRHQKALEDFLAAGGTYSQLSRELGVSRQAVRQYVGRGRHAAASDSE